MDTPTAGSRTKPIQLNRAQRATDRAAIAFLRHDVLPILDGSKREALARSVDEVVVGGELESLSRLPERARRELLCVIEELPAGAGPSPPAMVRLTSVLSGPVNQAARLYPLLAAPAR